MSVHGMKPTFKDREGYLAWRSDWSDLQGTLAAKKRNTKKRAKGLQRQWALTGLDAVAVKPNTTNWLLYLEMAKVQNELRAQRIMGQKLMSALQDAKVRRDKILAMRKGLKEQNATFPMEIMGASNIDFHFNKISLEFDFMPAWTLKAKGKSYYVNHVDCLTAWTTRETPDSPSTKGSLRIRKGNIMINTEGHATITA
jgi:hypothetical protein